MSSIWDYLNPLSVEELSRQFRNAHPTRYFVVDDFLKPDFMRAVRDSYPEYDKAVRVGHEFRALNESRKVQIPDSKLFSTPVRELRDVLASREFLDLMVEVTGIEGLVADEALVGGGMHTMASGGRLDVHVDFNRIEDRGLYRRLNILVFLCDEWKEEWGGVFELWNPTVTDRLFSALPIANRCVVFNTTETSYHGVTPIKSPEGITRNSFAAYYYTLDTGESSSARSHTTRFKARPNERWRKVLGNPALRSAAAVRRLLGRLRRRISRQASKG